MDQHLCSEAQRYLESATHILSSIPPLLQDRSEAVDPVSVVSTLAFEGCRFYWSTRRISSQPQHGLDTSAARVSMETGKADG
eukprot:evm.model.scf_3074.2 EVM.evm.TU.scf_3074.2   scf_3074:10704-12235(+)